jgi:hypothetical protein
MNLRKAVIDTSWNEVGPINPFVLAPHTKKLPDNNQKAGLRVAWDKARKAAKIGFSDADSTS